MSKHSLTVFVLLVLSVAVAVAPWFCVIEVSGLREPPREMPWSHLDGGGFNVAPDVTLAASAPAACRLERHFRLADSILDSTGLKRTLSARQTVYGPTMGIGLYI